MVGSVWVLAGGRDQWKRRRMVAAATAYGGCGQMALVLLFFLMELMDDGGTICIWRVVDGQESSIWYKQML